MYDPWVRKIPWGRKWQPTLVFLPGKSHAQSLACYSPWGCKESDTTEWPSKDTLWGWFSYYPFWQMMGRGLEGLQYCTGTAASREQGRVVMGASAAHTDALTTLLFCWPWTHSPRWLMGISPLLKISPHFPISSFLPFHSVSSGRLFFLALTLYLPPPPAPWKWTALKYSVSSLTLFSFGASSESSLAKCAAQSWANTWWP